MSKRSIYIVFLSGILFMSLTTKSIAKTISVRVTNINTSKPGNIMAMLFTEEGFPKKHDKALIIKNKKAESTELVFEFSVALEHFAVKILHDENEDGKTSKNWTGIIPSEGLGFTNGAQLSWRGAPKFKDAMLTLEDVAEALVIPIKYP
ncbi:DUF2141 domain-containing protein [Thalassotalea fusca]